MYTIIIDSANNDKVVNWFETKKQAEKYLREKFANTNTNESWREFRDRFYFVRPNAEVAQESGLGLEDICRMLHECIWIHTCKSTKLWKHA